MHDCRPWGLLAELLAESVRVRGGDSGSGLSAALDMAGFYFPGLSTYSERDGASTHSSQYGIHHITILSILHQ